MRLPSLHAKWKQRLPTNVLRGLLPVQVIEVSRYNPGSFRGRGHKGLWKLCSELREHKPESPAGRGEEEGTREAVPLPAYTQVEGGGVTSPQRVLDLPQLRVHVQGGVVACKGSTTDTWGVLGGVRGWGPHLGRGPGHER